MEKPAGTQYDLISPIKERWSPRTFASSPLDESEILELFEAARWSASSMNEQPWRFVYGLKGTDAFNELLKAVVPGNAVWAENAGALIAVFGKPLFDYKDRPNPTWQYDTGLAVGNLSVQATAKGVVMHQMGGVDHAKMIEVTAAPENLQPLVMIALGKPGDSPLSDELKERETAPRTRLALNEIVNHGKF